MARSAATGGRRRWLVAGGVLGALTTVGVLAALAFSGSSADAEEAADGPLATAQVQRRTLELTDETTATLVYVGSATVSAPVEGTVTALAAEGDVVEAGSVVASLDGEPVVALYGDLPPWRDLGTSADDGADVYQLELNLVALGYDPDGDIEIDQTYDSATAAAVELWQADLGVEETGEVLQSAVVYVPGRLLVDETNATIGAGVSSGTSLLSGRLVERISYVPSTSAAEGAIAGLATADTPVTTGTVLFTDGAYPVVAVVGDAATLPLLERDLSEGVSDGIDVELLEQTLASLGFDAGGELTVDDEFDTATGTALTDWYASLGLTPDDPTMLPAGGFVVVPSGLEVGAALVAEGTDPGVEAPVLTLTAPARVVSTTAPVGDDTFALGATVAVAYPDGTEVEGVVTEIGTVATNSTGQPDGQATVPITIEVTEIPEALAGFVEIPVDLRVVTESIPDAFVVPTTALLALAEGGYALEAVDGRTADGEPATRLIGVETGVFVDGFVEVTGADLSEGLEIVVAQ